MALYVPNSVMRWRKDLDIAQKKSTAMAVAYTSHTMKFAKSEACHGFVETQTQAVIDHSELLRL